jgi:glycosyltransferase involved in cell wall biosynthesis
MDAPVNGGRMTYETTFSFIVPIYDRTQKLRESVRSLYRQTFDNFEILLICDGSPEPTLEVVDELAEHPKVRVFKYQTNSGSACRGRNKGIAMARGEFVCFHDSDDIAHHERLTRTYSAIVQHKADAVYGPTKVLLDGTREIEGIHNGQVFDPPQFDFDFLRKTNLMMTCSVAVRRELLLRFGGFREEMRYREDHELWLRLAFHGCKWVRADALLCYYRIHSGNAELTLRGDDTYWYEQARYWFDKPFLA